MLLEYKSYQHLPSAEDLPDSDDTPVDNQLHLTPEERVVIAQQQATQAQIRTIKLEERLRSLGIDPNSI